MRYGIFMAGSIAAGACAAQAVFAGDVLFVEAAQSRGLGPYEMATGFIGGVAAADFDDDGDVDVFVPNGLGAADQLYRNLGDGTFEEIAGAAGVASVENCRAGLWFDYDGDGALDLVVARDAFYRFEDDPAETLLRLYRQVGDAVFEETTIAAGLFGHPPVPGPQQIGGLAAGDLDRDGDLDLILTQWTGRGFLYVNDGDGTFTDDSARLELEDPAGNNWQPMIHDFDGDGLLDVFVPVDWEANRLWMNDGQGGFVDRAAEAGVDYAWNDMGVALGDYDDDGDFDLYVTNIAWENPEGGELQHSELFRNDSTPGAPLFTEVSEAAGVDQGYWGWGATFLDAELDGDLDLAASNGYLLPPWDVDPSRLWVNMGDSPVSFADVSAPAGFGDTHHSSGLVAADLDRDGDLDLLQACDGLLRLLDNQSKTDEQHWLVVRPRLRSGNRRAIGATVVVTAGPLTLRRTITAGTSIVSQEPAEASFGLGPNAAADTVTVHWPDGTPPTTLTAVAGDRVVTIRPAHPGDLDGDGVVGFADLLAVVSAWGPCAGCPEDIDGDGIVGLADLLIVLSGWG